MNRKQSGFTLIEILITVAAVAILAAIAVPQYGQYITRSSLVEAQAGLGGYRVLMEQYYQDNRNYGTAACGAPAPSYKNFAHSCVVNNGGQGYTATATGSSGTRAAGFTYTIDQANTRRTTAVPSDWTAPSTNCFVTRKNGDC
jgi:type IV pilus assembly protein PilE